MDPVAGAVIVDAVESDGGHAYFWHGQDTYWRLGTNSWSEAWGEKGLFRMRRCDDSRLRKAGGEHWAVVQPVAPPPLSCWQRFTQLLRGGK
jgi:hypothetical protein